MLAERSYGQGKASVHGARKFQNQLSSAPGLHPIIGLVTPLPTFQDRRMLHFPNIDTFRKLAADHHLVPVYRCLLSDALTPVSAFQRLDDGGSACLFESVIGGEKVGRYSFLAAKPYAELSARSHHVTLKTAEGTTRPNATPSNAERLLFLCS